MPQTTTAGIQPASASSTKCLRGNPGAQTTQVRSQQTATPGRIQFSLLRVLCLPSSRRGLSNGKLHGQPRLRLPDASRSQGAASTTNGKSWRRRKSRDCPLTVESSGSRQGCGLRPRGRAPQTAEHGAAGQDSASACPDHRKDSIPGPGGLRQPRRAPKPRPRPPDGTDSRRMILDRSKRDTHRHGKMAERSWEGRVHGIMGSGPAIARLSKARQKQKN